MIEAKIIADSLALTGLPYRITTFELQYPRFIHGEVMTHRVFSRNAASSRAIPVKKLIQQVRENPAMPVWWGKNQPGMQANEELDEFQKAKARELWLEVADAVANYAEEFESIGLHKQVANRILEPFQWMKTLVTATEWANFFILRDHEDAQPEFRVLARKMREARAASVPIQRTTTAGHASWHIPYVSDEERQNYDLQTLLKISTARCARVSYLTHGGDRPRNEEDIVLYNRLVGSNPIHASPTEHQAFAFEFSGMKSNFCGWTQFRKYVEHGIVNTL
jgi:thymidylate synthase ThyX